MWLLFVLSAANWDGICQCLGGLVPLFNVFLGGNPEGATSPHVPFYFLVLKPLDTDNTDYSLCSLSNDSPSHGATSIN